MSVKYLEYQIKSMKKMMQRRLLFLEVTLLAINAALKSLEREIRTIKEIKE